MANLRTGHRLKNTTDWYPVNFGLDYNHNRDLMRFVPAIVMSLMPLSAEEIDSNAAILDWSVLSMRNLPDSIYIKYAHCISWDTFLKTPYAKNPASLYQCRKYVLGSAQIFDDPVYKLQYTDDEFAKNFPQLVDWEFAIVEKRLSIGTLEMHSQYVNCDLLCAHYEPSIGYLKHHVNKVNWSIVSRWNNIAAVINNFHAHVDLEYLLCRQQLTSDMINKLIYRIIPSYRYGKMLTRWQKLDCDFIERNLQWLNMKNVCQCQRLTKQFIKNNQHRLRLDYILGNCHLNNPGCDKFIQINGSYFYIEVPLVDIPGVHFCKENIGMGV